MYHLIWSTKQDGIKLELLNRFIYETRMSSRTFLEKIVQFRAEVLAPDLLPSVIQNLTLNSKIDVEATAR